MRHPLHIAPYHVHYGPLHATFLDSQEKTCILTEAITCDITPRLFLGVHGRLMDLDPARVRQLIPPLLHFAHHGRLPHPHTTPTGDYEI